MFPTALSTHPRVNTHFPSVSFEQVLLVGILGEDRITCSDAEVLDDVGGRVGSFGLLLTASALLVTLCVTLLTNDAAQNMASWTFHGNHRVGAVVGLVLCAMIPASLFAWQRHRNTTLLRSIEECPLVDEPDLSTRR